MPSYFNNTSLEEGSYCSYLIPEAVELQEFEPYPRTPS